MRRLAISVLVLVLVLLLVLALGCSTSADDTVVDPPQTCQVTLEELAAAFSRCGRDYQQSYDAQLQAIAGGDCANVASIRDEEALRELCFPSLKEIACAELEAARLDAACIQQLQRSK
jgi:hypothetical protein